MAVHEIIVGNIGTVHIGNFTQAAECYAHYRSLSKHGSGSTAGESVTWLKDGDVYREYTGTLDKEV